MALLRSGLVLFVSETLVATLILLALAYLVMGWSPHFISDLKMVLYLTILTLPSSAMLMVMASRGRRQPVTDGVTLMTCIALAVCGFVVALPGPSSEFGKGFDAIILAAYGGVGLACVVPAYLITYFALRRTPLLSPLAPPRKAKGPAEASP